MTAPQPGDALAPIRRLVQNQPWYQKFSKALAGAIGSLVGVVWVATTFGFDVPDSVERYGLAGIALLTVLGIYQVPSGVTSSQLNQIEKAYVGRHRLPEE